MRVEVYNASNQIVTTQDISEMDLPTDSWQRMSGVIAVPSDGVKVRFWMGGYPSSDPDEPDPGMVYFDDALLSSDASGEAMQSLFVPAGAATHGQAGTYWSTNGWFSNITDVNLTIAGAFLYQGRDNSASVASPVTLGTIPPSGFTQLDDLVTLLGESEKTGGIYLELSGVGSDLPAELAVVTTHTFTPNPYGDGVYGQGIPAVPAGTRSRVVVPGVFQGSVLRTNIGALNTSGSEITLDVTILSGGGDEQASTTWVLQPYEQRQVSLPSLGVSNLDGGSVIFELSGHGSFRANTSTVDQSSGDAVYNEAR